jgi:uncharacterized membrane protein YdbT with pleckstrin-like domain
MKDPLNMGSRHRLSKLFRSQGAGLTGLFFAYVAYLAFIAASWTGDSAIPGLVTVFMIVILVRMAVIAVIAWPILIAAIMVWTGYNFLLKKRMAKNSCEASSRVDRPAGAGS